MKKMLKGAVSVQPAVPKGLTGSNGNVVYIFHGADEMERIWKEAFVASSRYCPDIYLHGLWKTARNLSQDRRCPLRDSNEAPPEYKSRQLPLHNSVFFPLLSPLLELVPTLEHRADFSVS
jgi:hypothetical protein